MTPDRQKALDEARVLMAAIAAIEAATLARVELSQEVNFADVVPTAAEVLELFKQLNQRDISRLSTSGLTSIVNQSKHVKDLIAEIQKFSIAQGDAMQTSRSIIERWVASYDQIFNALYPLLSFTATQATDYSKLEREATGFHKRIKDELDDTIKVMDAGKVEAAKALSAIKEQAATLGASSNAVVFSKAADEHRTNSEQWYKSTKWMTVITLVAALASLAVSISYVPETVAGSVQIVVSKLIVLSTLSLFTVWCAGNYRSEKHNETLYRHRANALITFKTFVEGSSEPRIKDAILMYAAQTAFSPRPTGFERSDHEPQHVNPVVEIVGKSIPSS